MSKKIVYDFIEIGTSNFNTIIEDCPEDSVGLSVEPLEEYLNQLPTKKQVTKVCCAVKGSGHDEEKKIYFIPEKEIDRIGLPVWLKGCNSVAHVHDRIEPYSSIMESKNVSLISIERLLEKYNACGCACLKIDTEGYDFRILKGFYEYIDENKDFVRPDWIQFEGRVMLDNYCNQIISLFTEIGYELEYVQHDNYVLNGNDYLLVLNKDE